MSQLTERRAAVLAFVTAASVLFLQVLVHRIIQVKLLNNFAFYVIALTMLGFAFSGVLLTRILNRVTADTNVYLVQWAALFVLTTLFSTVLFYRIPATRQAALTNTDFVLSFLSTMPLALLFAIPFAFCGLTLGALLSLARLRTRLVYGFDLAGSAFGAFLVVPAIANWGVERSLLLGCAALLAATLALSPTRRRSALALSAAALLCLTGVFMFQSRILKMSYSFGSVLLQIERRGSPYGVEYTEWDPVARVELSRIWTPTPSTMAFPCLVGENASLHKRFDRIITMNSFVFTYVVAYDGDRRELDGIEETIYSAAYHARTAHKPRVLVIGVGGGIDVLTAIAFDASEIVGVEVNGAMLDILENRYRDTFRHWVQDPRLRLVHDDGRHYLATTKAKYDIIQVSGVDSYSGTPAAAHVFSESYLYTAEAFDLYLSRLAENGVLNLMRLEYMPRREMLRAAVSAVAALRRAGVAHPARHIVMVQADTLNFTALLVKKSPFKADEVARIRAWASGGSLMFVAYAPGGSATPNAYQTFLSLDDPRSERAFAALYPFDITPATDERPFFFHHSRWSHLFSSNPALRTSVPAMEYSVVILLVIIGLATLVCVYLPLRLLAKRGVIQRGNSRSIVYFAGLGVGFMAIEIALLQRFGLFLGHPNYALSVVLAALLVTTGLGALMSNSIVKRLGHLRFLSYILATAILFEQTIVFPQLAAHIGWPFALRVAAVFALIGPIGVAMGVFLPYGLEQLKRLTPGQAPWAWGVNAIFSVLGPVLSVAVSITWGIHILLLMGVMAYLVVGLVGIRETNVEPA